MTTGKALVFLGVVVVAVGGGVGIAFLMRGSGGSTPSLPSPGGAATAAPGKTSPQASASGNPLDAIGGAINAIGGIATSVDHLFGGALSGLFGMH
jgi:hypothetical protein